MNVLNPGTGHKHTGKDHNALSLKRNRIWRWMDSSQQRRATGKPDDPGMTETSGGPHCGRTSVTRPDDGDPGESRTAQSEFWCGESKRTGSCSPSFIYLTIHLPWHCRVCCLPSGTGRGSGSPQLLQGLLTPLVHSLQLENDAFVSLLSGMCLPTSTFSMILYEQTLQDSQSVSTNSSILLNILSSLKSTETVMDSVTAFSLSLSLFALSCLSNFLCMLVHWSTYLPWGNRIE